MERDKIALYATALAMSYHLEVRMDQTFNRTDRYLVDAMMLMDMLESTHIKDFIRKSGKISEVSEDKLRSTIQEMQEMADHAFGYPDSVRKFFMLSRLSEDAPSEGAFKQSSFEAFAYDPVKGEVAIAILKCQLLFRIDLGIGAGMREYALAVARRLAIPVIDALEFASEIAKEALDDYVEFNRRR